MKGRTAELLSRILSAREAMLRTANLGVGPSVEARTPPPRRGAAVPPAIPFIVTDGPGGSLAAWQSSVRRGLEQTAGAILLHVGLDGPLDPQILEAYRQGLFREVRRIPVCSPTAVRSDAATRDLDAERVLGSRNFLDAGSDERGDRGVVLLGKGGGGGVEHASDDQVVLNIELDGFGRTAGGIPDETPGMTLEAEILRLIRFLRSRRVFPTFITISRLGAADLREREFLSRAESFVLAGLVSLYELKRENDTASMTDGSASNTTHLDFPAGRLVLVPTGCNNRCIFCMADEFIERNTTPSAPRGDQPVPEDLARVIAEAPAGSLLDLYGAEPTLHPSFLGLLGCALEQGRTVTMASNARIFSSLPYTRKIAEMAEGRLTVRTTILGADAPVHDRIAGAPGSFDQTLRGVTNLVAEGVPVNINFVLCEPNITQVEEIAERSVALGACEIKISGIIDLERNHALFVPHDRAAEAVERFCRVADRHGVVGAIEKLPFCIAPERMHQMVYEHAFCTPDRVLLDAPGLPCATCVVRNVCYGVEDAYVDRWGSEGLKSVSTLPERVLTPVSRILEGNAEPPKYRVTFIRTADAALSIGDWQKLLEFKARCEVRLGTLCIERDGVG